MDNLRELPSKPLLSLCVIVKNEIKNLPRCLDSVKSYVDEMIIVDTGSKDGTPDIAAKYGAKISYFKWCDDFAAARNYTVSQASGDWILMLDADEELVVNCENFLEEIIAQPQIIAYKLAYSEVTDQSNLSKSTPLYRTSLFRNLSNFRYVGRFHEYLTYHNKDSSGNYSRHLKSLSILHYGFSKKQLQQKNLSRNIPILERIRQEEGLSLRLLSCLAGMYADTQQPEKAQECSAELFERLVPNLIEGNPPDEFAFVLDMLHVLGEQALREKDYETVRLICQRGLEWCPNYPPLNYLAGVTLRALGFLVGAAGYLKNCIRLGQEGSYYKGEPFALDYMTTYPAYDLGCIYIELERPQEALAAFELALAFDADLTAAQEKADIIRQYLATQA
jgi:glycosyltransferase involved in cell wall biosynthesis